MRRENFIAHAKKNDTNPTTRQRAESYRADEITNA
jgi:hypothetical protein